MRQSSVFLDDNKYTFIGTHIIAEVYGVDKVKLDNTKLLIDSIKKGVELSGATICEIKYKKFKPHGCTIIAILSESHVSIHTYPELGNAFIDAFTCGVLCNPKKIIEQLNLDLNAEFIEIREIKRGKNDLCLK